MAGIFLTCGIAHAQSTGNSTDSTHRGMHHWSPRSMHHWGPRRDGDGPSAWHRDHKDRIRYTPEQRRQVMVINKDFHDKSAELFKKDNITLKEYKAGLVALQKDKRSKMEALLTPQQKEQIERRKKLREENRQVAEAGHMERLKLHLGLSDDQVAKIKAGQADLHTQVKAIRENDNLLPQEKMEQMKGLMARRKDVFKSILTPEQFSKFEEMSHRRGFDREGHEGHEGPGGPRGHAI